MKSKLKENKMDQIRKKNILNQLNHDLQIV